MGWPPTPWRWPPADDEWPAVREEVVPVARLQSAQLRLLGLAEDVAQDVLTELHGLPAGHPDVNTYDSYRNACHRRCRNAARRQATKRRLERADNGTDLVGSVPFDPAVVAKENLSDPLDLEIARLRYEEGLTLAEIGERLGLTKWEVYRRLKRIREQLS